MADMASIKLFHSMLAPVMEAIPQVISMMEQKADMDRTMAAYQADIEKAKADVQAAYDEADKRIAESNAVLVALAEKHEALRQEVAQASADAEAAKMSAADAINQAKYAADAAILSHNTRASEVETKAKARMEAADADALARAAQLEQSIADLEKREAAAQKALDNLRAKLG